jgi:hypothetical protein
MLCCFGSPGSQGTAQEEYNANVQKTIELSKAVVGRDKVNEKITKTRNNIAVADQQMDETTAQQEAIIRKKLQTKSVDQLTEEFRSSKKMDPKTTEKFIAMAKRIASENQ